MKKKAIRSFFLFCVSVTIFVLFAYVSCVPPTTPPSKPTPVPTAESTPEPEPTPEPPEPTAEPTSEPEPSPGESAGDVWLVPQDQTVLNLAEFSTEIHMNSGEQSLAAYGINIYYEAEKMYLNTTIGDEGIEVGADGFIAAANTENPGEIKLSGFDLSGKGPGPDLHLLTLYWIADTAEPGTTVLDVYVDRLADPDIDTIGTPAGYDGTVTIE